MRDPRTEAMVHGPNLRSMAAVVIDGGAEVHASRGGVSTDHRFIALQLNESNADSKEMIC